MIFRAIDWVILKWHQQWRLPSFHFWKFQYLVCSLNLNKQELTNSSNSRNERQTLMAAGGAEEVLLKYLLICFKSAQGHLMLRATREISRALTWLIVSPDCDSFD